MINGGKKKVEGRSMRSVYVQSRSLVGRGRYERKRMAWYVSGRFGRYGQRRWGLL